MKQRTPFNTTHKQNSVGLLGITMLAFAIPVSAYTGQELAGEAAITLAQARVIALKAHPGKITDAELEREKGGSGLRYSFDIRESKATQEVGVDAKTGQVLENVPAGKNPD
jgi:hypothetical protein